MQNYYLLTLLLSGALLAQRAGPPPPRILAGSLTGTIATPDGRPVSKALVILRLQPRTGVDLPDFTLHANANPQGEFTLKTLPVGKYTLCPQSPGDDVVSPCDWSRQPPEVEIVNGRASTIRLTMAKGVRVTLQIDDAAQHLASNANRARPPTITVGVTTPHGFLPARPKNRGAVRREYEVVVPFATPTDAFILADGVEIEEDNGRKAVNKAIRIPLRLKDGDPPKSANARITGLAAN